MWGVKKQNSLRVEWRLKQGKGQSINAHYALKYRMDSGKAHVSVSLPAYDNDSLASGTCHQI
ncbi:MAG: hypothetical protein HRU33_12885 [Rhodobacteraceae bacterium]|nr:hypothetical protein [Paracoccaceae bacterium]